MPLIDGFQIRETLYHGRQTTWYLAYQTALRWPVLLKVLEKGRSWPQSIIEFRREYEISVSLNIEGLLKPLQFVLSNTLATMVFHDFGAVDLKTLIRTTSLSVEEILRLGITLSRILGRLHRAGLIHQALHPADIFYNRSTGQLQLGGLGSAGFLPQSTPAIKNLDFHLDNLPYISPESTGRMNRLVDHRADIYSFGVILYELLAGRLPFASTDALEIVYAHLAKIARPLGDFRPDVPKTLVGLVHKLLVKNAEDRYQSMMGVEADLEECLKRLNQPSYINEFVLARFDAPDGFHIPQKLYGREQDINTLLTAYQRINRGSKEIFLVVGPAGVGKTSLIRETCKPIAKARGYFINGTFDQFQNDIPYSSVVNAFQDLIRQLLTEGSDSLREWQTRLQQALGQIGQVIIEVIPEVELIIGAQPGLPDLGVKERKNRFQYAFRKFIQVFCHPDRPLVLFLDNLHWADSASLELLKLMMLDQSTEYLLVIGAFRDQEVGSGHPLSQHLSELEQEGAMITKLHLKELTPVDIGHLVADSVHRTGEAVDLLARLIYEKTLGNPFFVKEFLKSLYANHLLIFSLQTRTWQWDIHRVQALGMSDNVVELLVEKIRRLTPGTQRVLIMAAMFGNQFDLDRLTLVLNQSRSELATSLTEAKAAGLILPLIEELEMMPGMVDDSPRDRAANKDSSAQTITAAPWGSFRRSGHGGYWFAHDRIQQAAYSLISQAEKKFMHLEIGRLILRHTTPIKLEKRIIEIVTHMNLGRDLLSSQDERHELAELNLLAGRRAKASAAYAPGWRYLQAGLEVLDEKAWTTNYQLALVLHEEAAEAAYLCADFEAMEKLTGRILERARTALDKIRTYEIKIQSLAIQNRLQESIQTTTTVLQLLGVKFPSRPGPRSILVSYLRTKWVLTGKSMENLKSRPGMSDPQKLAAMRIMLRGAVTAYMVAPKLFPLMMFEMVRMTVKYGVAPSSSFAFTAYGLILCGVMGDIEKGYRYGRLGLSLLDRFPFSELTAQVIYAYNATIQHWKEHSKSSLESLKSAYRLGLETGEIEYAYLAAAGYAHQAFRVGVELTALESELAFYHATLRQFRFLSQRYVFEIGWQGILNLIHTPPDPTRLVGEVYDEDKFLPLHLKANQRAVIAFLKITKLMLCYLFHRLDQALATADFAEKYLDSITSFALVSVFYFYDSLTRLGLYSQQSPLGRKQTLKKVTANQKILKKYAHHAPMNLWHKCCLVDAELCRVRGHLLQASTYYDQAIDAAKTNEFVAEEALAAELAGRFYLDQGRLHFARAYLWTARQGYIKWGALAKVRDLEIRYPDLNNAGIVSPRLVATGSPEEVHPRLSPEAEDQAAFNLASLEPYDLTQEILDLTAAVDAAQAVFSEIDLDRLLDKMLKTTLEISNASHGYFILRQDDQLVAAAHSSAEKDETIASLPRKVDDRKDLSIGIVRFVARTKETVVLNDALHIGAFTQDEYVQRKRPKSIMCFPIMNNRELLGLLYLENSYTSGVFTAKRLGLLQLLSAQAAVFMENAKLFAELEQQTQNLGAAEEKYRLLFENAAIGVCQLSAEGRCLTANQALAKILGYEDAQSLLESVQDVWTKFILDQQAFQLLTFHLRETGQVNDFHLEIVRRDGTRAWLNLNIRAIFDQEGQVVRYEGFIRDITVEKEAQAALAQYQDRLRALASELAAAEERERRRLATDLHDSAAQNLAVALRRLDDLNGSEQLGPTSGLVLEIRELVAQSIKTIRSLMFELSPPVLYDLGLVPALEWLAEHFFERYNLQVFLTVLRDPGQIPLELRIILFRVVRELLINVVKHAHTSKARLIIFRHGPDVTIRVEDRGIGMDPEIQAGPPSKHFGLFSVRERLAVIGGALEIVSEKDQGTKGTVTVPIGEG